MATSRYEVVCELDLGSFDDARVGHRTAKRAHAELRRLARRDGRIDSTRFRRNGRRSVEISLTVAATTSHDAFDHCHAMLRTAVHATGGSTRGWDHLCSEIRAAGPTAGPARGTEELAARLAPSAPTWADLGAPGRLPGARPERTVAAAPGWAAATETAQRRGAAPDWLPPLGWGPVRQTVIDLRID